MSEALIRQQIYTTLAAVPNVGRVYDYERWAVNWDKFIELFKDSASGRILGWEICRSRMGAQKISTREEEHTHEFTMRGYMAVKDADATEKLFNAVIEAIGAAFRNNHTLNDTCIDAGPLSVEILDTRMFGGVLCHYAELKLPAVEII